MNFGAPNVYSQETDISQVTRISTNINFAVVGQARKGRAGVPVFCSTNKQLIDTFGNPDPSLGYGLYSALAIVRQGGNVWFSRVAPEATYPILLYTSSGGETPYSLFSTDTATDDPEGYEFGGVTEMFIAYPIGPGTGYNNLKLLVNQINDEEDEFILNVLDADRGDLVLESFACSLTYKKDGFGRQMFIEDMVNTYSNLIRVKYNSETTGSPTAPADPETDPSEQFTGGDDADAAADNDIVGALNAFEDTSQYPLVALVNAGYATPAVHNRMDAIAALRDDCIAILDLPSASQTVDAALTYRNTTLNLSSSYSMLVGPDYLFYDEYSDRKIYVPPSGEVAARMVYTDTTRDPWIAIAGLNRGLFRNCEGLRHNYTAGQQKQLYDAQINYVLTQPGEGHALWGQSTLQRKFSALSSVNVRRLLNIIKPSLAAAAKYSLWEPNDELLRARLVQMVDEFLQQVKNRRGLYDYKVVCDESNNPPELIDQLQLNLDVYLKPVRATEFIKVQSVLTPTGADFSELISTGGNF